MTSATKSREFYAHSAGYEALSPDDTYFVVFSYGAVVLFQGVRTCFLPTDAAATTSFKPLRLQPHSVKPPVDPPYPSGPWDTDLHEWREAAAAAETARDDEIIMLLLRPFMHNLKDNLAVRVTSLCTLACALLFCARRATRRVHPETFLCLKQAVHAPQKGRRRNCTALCCWQCMCAPSAVPRQLMYDLILAALQHHDRGRGRQRVGRGEAPPCRGLGPQRHCGAAAGDAQRVDPSYCAPVTSGLHRAEARHVLREAARRSTHRRTPLRSAGCMCVDTEECMQAHRHAHVVCRCTLQVRDTRST